MESEKLVAYCYRNAPTMVFQAILWPLQASSAETLGLGPLLVLRRASGGTVGVARDNLGWLNGGPKVGHFFFFTTMAGVF